MKQDILIGLGANLARPDQTTPLETCREAVRALAELRGLRLAAVSPWYESAPIPASDQPPFVNAVALLVGEADPATLLSALQAIEERHFRTRGSANAARTLDLDIIAMGNIIRLSPDPILPHPRAHLRAFVLRPLADVSPGWVHPGQGLTVEALLARLPPQVIGRIGA